MRKMKKCAGVVVFVVILLLVAGPVIAQDQVIKWKLQDQYAGSGWQAMYLTVPLIEWVNKATNGRLQTGGF